MTLLNLIVLPYVGKQKNGSEVTPSEEVLLNNFEAKIVTKCNIDNSVIYFQKSVRCS